MKRLDVILAGAAGVCVLAFAVLQGARAWVGSPQAAEDTAIVEDASGERATRARSLEHHEGAISLEEAREIARAKRRAANGGLAMLPDRYGEQGRGLDGFGLGPDPGLLGPEDAKEAFQAVLSELDASLAEERRLSRREKKELYNRATGSYTALLTYVDGSDPTQRKFLDEAHAALLHRMAELKLDRPREKYRPERRR
jgi:hypothetical protein